jgi:hypothetical protein
VGPLSSSAPEPALDRAPARARDDAVERARDRFSPRPRRGATERLAAWLTTGPLGHLYGVGADVAVFGGRWLLVLARRRARAARDDVRGQLRASGRRRGGARAGRR